MRIISEFPNFGSGDVTRQPLERNPFLSASAVDTRPRRPIFWVKARRASGEKNSQKIDERRSGNYLGAMKLWEIRSIVLAAAFFATGLPLEAKGPSQESSTAVQTLANFPALQRLSAKSKPTALRTWLRKVAAEYREAGYGEFSRELAKAGSLVTLFGNPRSDARPGTLKKARATVRHLRAALARNPRILLPETTGEKIPDYLGLAAAFTKNAGRALKNLADGQNVANTLRRKIKPAVITKTGDEEFIFTGTASLVEISTAGSLTTTSGSTGYSYTTAVGSGTLTLSGATSAITSLGGSVTVVGNLGFGLPTLASLAGYRWIAFPPGEEVPTEWTDIHATITLDSGGVAGTLTLASGTRLVQAAAEYALPPNTTEIPGDTTLDLGTLASGTFSIATPTPTPSE
jgi:hypothetical protein